MIKREIEISGKKVPFRSSATIPRLYRAKFKRDIFKDLSKLEKSYRGKTENGEELQIEDLEIFENVAYVMAYHADNSIPANIEDWLDQFDMFSIYEVLPQILELWGENLVTDVTSKKRLAEVSGKGPCRCSFCGVWNLGFPSVIWICSRLGWFWICGRKKPMTA